MMPRFLAVVGNIDFGVGKLREPDHRFGISGAHVCGGHNPQLAASRRKGLERIHQGPQSRHLEEGNEPVRTVRRERLAPELIQ